MHIIRKVLRIQYEARNWTKTIGELSIRTVSEAICDTVKQRSKVRDNQTRLKKQYESSECVFQ